MFSLILSSFLLAKAEEFTLQTDYESSKSVLSLFQPEYKDRSHYFFLKSINSYALNEKKETIDSLDALDWSINYETPRRYKSMLYILREQIKQWDDNPLTDIERDMIISTDKLNNNYIGKKTQKIQEQIIKKLDKLIKEEEENNEKNNNKSKDSKSEKEKSSSSKPATESLPMGGSGAGVITEKQLKGIAENWGTLPAEKRAAIIRDLTKDVPAQYKQLIEEYFRNLRK